MDEIIYMVPPELSPCPHCGGPVAFHRHEDGTHCLMILCDGCRAKFDFSESAFDPRDFKDHVEQVVLRWNTRCLETAEIVREQVMGSIPEDVKRKYF